MLKIEDFRLPIRGAASANQKVTSDNHPAGETHSVFVMFVS